MNSQESPHVLMQCLVEYEYQIMSSSTVFNKQVQL